MHIVILADPVDNQKAGVFIYSKKIIENLLKIDKKNTYSFIHLNKNPFFKGKNHHIIPRLKIPGYGTFRKFFLIPRLIKKLKPDIVWEMCHIGPFNIPKNIKRVVTIHDLTPILFPQFHIKNSIINHKIHLKRIVKNADLILCPSQNTKKDIEKIYRTKAKIAVTPLGIDTYNKDRQHRPIKKQSKAPYLAYLGTIEPRKNLEMLIKAFSELKKEKDIPHQLLLAGEIGWKAAGIMQKIQQTKDVKHLNYLSENQKAQFLKNADVFIYPSLYEGFGLPILEAMSHKTPVIFAKNSSMNEYFGNYGLSFPPQSKKTLKKHIFTLLTHHQKAKKIGEKGYKYSKSFSWKKTAKETLENFEQIMNN